MCILPRFQKTAEPHPSHTPGSEQAGCGNARSPGVQPQSQQALRGRLRGQARGCLPPTRGRDRPADQGEALCLSARDTLVAGEGEPSHETEGLQSHRVARRERLKLHGRSPGETLPVTPVTVGKRLPVCNTPPAGAASQPCPRGGQRPAPDWLPQTGPHSPGAASPTARSHGRRGPRSPTSGGRHAASRGWCGAGRRRQRARPVSWGQTDRHRECRDGCRGGRATRDGRGRSSQAAVCEHRGGGCLQGWPKE